MNTAPIILEVRDTKLTIWPAFVYLEYLDSTYVEIPEQPEGFTLGVPFPTARYGDMHKNFGLLEDNGELQAYGLASVLSDTPEPTKVIEAAQIGAIVSWRGDLYRIRKAANNNIEFEKLGR
jgi:hypothetical protein